MTGFEPIAIVGESCVLPGALSPDALWDMVAHKRVVIARPPAGTFGLTPDEEASSAYVSGIVQGFEDIFDPAQFRLNGIEASALDPVCAWPLHAAMQAWTQAGSPKIAGDRGGVFVANLSYPSRGHADYAADVWRSGGSELSALQAFNSALPARLIAEALGVTGPAFALDAACASSLYAVEIACRKLQTRQLDCAVVAAVNAADNLILHIGFEALKALSPTGQSRPFVQGADGLVPSEGAVAIVLKRLCDVEDGETVHGIIRGIGLSNDGRRKGLLAPDRDGQSEAMRRAYRAAGIAPETLDFLECHATGTPTGDSVEIFASADVFIKTEHLPVGSLKANTGHLITVAGLASLLKLTGAMAHEILPPMPLLGPAISAFDGTALVPQGEAQAWRSRDNPRRAAISNFGFGGNNAHLILEQYQAASGAVSVMLPEQKTDEIVICGIGLLAGQDQGCHAVLRRLMNQPLRASGPCTQIGADALLARTPPNDLTEAEPQQLAIMATVDEALAGLILPQPDRCGIYVGMACAADSARWLLSARLANKFGRQPGSAAVAKAQTDIAPVLTSAAVLGAMANMTANRVTYARDFRGLGFSVSGGAASGLAALELACDRLRAGILDMAIAAVADFSSEPVRADALQRLGIVDVPGDQSAALVLKRRSDAEAAGDPIYGTVTDLVWGDAGSVQSSAGPVREVYGSAPAATVLVDLAVQALLSAYGLRLRKCGAVVDLSGKRGKSTAIVTPSGPLNQNGSVTFKPAAPQIFGDPLRPAPRLFWAAAKTRALLAAKIAGGKTGGRGNFRIAVLGKDADELAARLEIALAALEGEAAPQGPGLHYGEGKARGEMAFLFTGSAAVYPRMARGLLMAFPELAHKLAKLDKADDIAPLLSGSKLSEFEQLCAGTLVSQAHAILLKDVLGVKPEAAIGLSLGESNALFAFGFWRDPGALLDEISDAAMYERHIGGTFETAAQAWGPNVPGDWSNWRVQAPVKDVKALLKSHAGAEITIIYSDTDCMIGGPAPACRALCDTLGKGAGTKMNQHLIVHARAMQPFAETWRRLHTRKIYKGSDVRLYANAINAAYEPTSEVVADMLTRQAVSTVDFPATIRQAWDDGVRTFVELGPRDTLTRSLASILGDKPFTAIAADRIETSDLGQIAELAAVLFADGRACKIALVAKRLEAARRTVRPQPKANSAVRPVPYPMPILPEPVRGATMPRAPDLPVPVSAESELELPNFEPVTFPHPPGYEAPPVRKVNSGNEALPLRLPSGPSWDRAAIEASTRGLMSDLFGPGFKAQDKYEHQVRLPADPLLLVDRITGIEAEAQVNGPGVIWTETDLKAQDWSIHDGRIRPGLLIESGQADLTLIAWMGADLLNQSERVYRLLGCEITFHEGGLPGPGETLKFQIEITGHATLAGVRMFFFQYDCTVAGRPVFSVRNGQAGFFTNEELASGKGVVWDAAKDTAPTSDPASFTAELASQKRTFSASDLAQFRAGDALGCFGPGFEMCAAQSRPAHLPDGKLALFDEITEFDPAGGPWRRGYLKARASVPKDTWFYTGHFHNDPCMPGTLMAEAAVQTLEFYAAAAGLTIDRDGYIFEPMPGHMTQFVCRGQVIPDADHEVTYEVFIDEIVDGDAPVLYASLLARRDGHKVFHCPRFGVRLRPNWPAARVSDTPLRIGPNQESRGDYAALLDCANGAPSAAFGDMYAPFDHADRVPRLPQPPYHMMTRVLEVSTRPAQPEVGARVMAEYDVPPDAWYFEDNRNGTMPFAVLSEVALQPCGWLASHGGFAVSGGLRFRNLEGDGHLHAEVLRDAGTLTIETTLSSFSRVGPMTIVSFELQVRFGDGRPVLDLKTQFGFFPAAALVRQAGLPAKPNWTALFDAPGAAVDTDAVAPRLAGGQLNMLDAVDMFDPLGGEAGLGIIRGRQSVDPSAWYFKAHFYQDPVQPGSLGLDALAQLIGRAALLKGLDAGMSKPHVETIATDAPVKWSYRGEITPNRKEVVTVVEITAIEPRGSGFLITANGSLWRDGLRVYEVKPMCVAVVDHG